MFNKIKTIVSGIVFGLAGILLTVSVVNAQVAGNSDAFTDGPSAFCHVTDGAFTDCKVNNGVEEWSDITPSFFDVFADVPGPESALYVDQADLDPTRKTSESEVDTLVLMYDEMFRTTPLLVGESVHVHFMTVDEGALVHYDVLIDTSGIKEVRINGVLQDPMPSGLTGMAGYGTSPNSATPHVMAELQIGLEAAGFTSEECCYSPDPAWWGSSVPGEPQEGCPEDKDCDGVPDSQDPCPGTPGVNCLPPEPCLDDLDCDGVPDRDDQCPLEPSGINNNLVNDGQGCPHPQQKPGEEEETTAGIFTAHLDGRTTVDPEPLLPPGEEPALCESIGRIVDFRVPPEGEYKNHGDYMRKVAQLAEALVNSQVEAGLITPEEAEELQSCVVNPRARSDVGKKT